MKYQMWQTLQRLHLLLSLNKICCHVTNLVPCHISERSEVKSSWKRFSVCRADKIWKSPLCPHLLTESTVLKSIKPVKQTCEAQSLWALDQTRAFRLCRYRPWLNTQLMQESLLSEVPGSKLIRVVLSINSSAGFPPFKSDCFTHLWAGFNWAF